MVAPADVVVELPAPAPGEPPADGVVELPPAPEAPPAEAPAE